MTDASVDTARASAVLRRMEIDVTRRLDGILHGDYSGLVPGHGSELGEAREYQAGDDVRRIDWHVTARTDQLHVRDTIADRELETWIIADCSPSLSFGTALMDKHDLVLRAASAVGFLTSRGGNRIGAVISANGTSSVHPAKSGRKNLLAILDHILRTEQSESGAPSPLGPVLEKAGAVMKRRGLVVVISDYLDPPETWFHQLSTLQFRHHVLAVEVVDPRELELPSVGVLALTDPETGRTREVDTSSANLRRKYAEAAAAQRSAIESAVRRAGADHLQLRTDRDWLGDFARHVSAQKRRHANISKASR